MGWTTLAEMIGGFHAGQSIKALRGQVDATQPGNVTPLTPRGHRTPEQIKAQLEARYAEIAREAANPARQFPCRTCRYWADYGYEGKCHNALVKGFSEAQSIHAYGIPKLCGPEKALWEPKRSLWQRFIDWFLEPWKGAN